MRMWADMEYYKNKYGGVMELTQSDLLNAQAYVDYITDRRIQDEDVDDNIRNAVCAVAEICHTADSHADILSENNDGYSVNYDNSASGEVDSHKYNVAALHLPARLLYRGLDV